VSEERIFARCGPRVACLLPATNRHRPAHNASLPLIVAELDFIPAQSSTAAALSTNDADALVFLPSRLADMDVVLARYFMHTGRPGGQHKLSAVSAHRSIWRETSRPKLYSKGPCQPWIENVLVCFVESQEPARHEIVCGRSVMRVKRHP
jgi:hypothetical protein